jgi:PilZ domain/Predicted nucleotide-binding protein containing TIR-like domain
MNTGPRARLFAIASSPAGYRIARAIQSNLESDVECTVWNPERNLLALGPLEALEECGKRFDFAAIILANGDVPRPSAHAFAFRDSVVLQSAYFMGRLGRGRTFLVQPGTVPFLLPSGLDLVVVEHGARNEDNLRAALAPACTRMRQQIQVARTLPMGSTPPNPGPESPPARRRRRRSLGVIHQDARSVAMRVVDISVTGALLETNGAIPVGTRLDLEIELENGDRVQVAARVVRVQHPGWQRTGGIGVKFDYVPREQLDRLRNYVEAETLAA